MPDYYIRSNDSEEARGPFDLPKLASLAESGHVTRASLYYDEENEQWVPVGTNEALVKELFPERKKLALRTAERPTNEAENASGGKAEGKASKPEPEPEPEGADIQDLLAAAEGTSADTRYRKSKERSAELAAKFLCPALGLMFLVSGFSLLFPNIDLIGEAFENRRALLLFNSPFVIVGLIDLLLALFVFLAVTEIFPVLRGRAAVGLGFSLYVGWVLGDMSFMLASTGAWIGLFAATCTQRAPVMFASFALAFAGLGWMAVLALNGHFEGVFDSIRFEWFGS